MKWETSVVALLATLALAAPQQKAASGVNDAANNGQGVSGGLAGPALVFSFCFFFFRELGGGEGGNSADGRLTWEIDTGHLGRRQS